MKKANGEAKPSKTKKMKKIILSLNFVNACTSDDECIDTDFNI